MDFFVLIAKRNHKRSAPSNAAAVAVTVTTPVLIVNFATLS